MRYVLVVMIYIKGDFRKIYALLIHFIWEMENIPQFLLLFPFNKIKLLNLNGSSVRLIPHLPRPLSNKLSSLHSNNLSHSSMTLSVLIALFLLEIISLILSDTIKTVLLYHFGLKYQDWIYKLRNLVGSIQCQVC